MKGWVNLTFEDGSVAHFRSADIKIVRPRMPKQEFDLSTKTFSEVPVPGSQITLSAHLWHFVKEDPNRVLRLIQKAEDDMVQF